MINILYICNSKSSNVGSSGIDFNLLILQSFRVLYETRQVHLMGRIMAIDYGKKRTGLAVSDPERIIASPLTTVDTPKLMDYLKTYCQQEPVDVFVVGEAKHLNNTPSESAQYIEPFVVSLKNAFPDKEVARLDERFTSKIAFQAMIDGGLKKKQRQNKGLIDTISATVILQDYMRAIH